MRTVSLLRGPLVAALLLVASPAVCFVWPNVVEQVARALSAGDVSERRLAAQRLTDLPPETGLRLAQQALGDLDVEVRLRAARAAVVLRMPRGGDQVITWLSESDARLRLAAADVIHASPTDRSVAALGRVLGDPDPHVRLSAASAMGSAGFPEAVSPLLGHLDDPAAEVREEVVRALGRIGDSRAVVPLIGKVQDAVFEVRKVATRVLGELGDARATSALMMALQDASSEVQLEAVTALGRLRSEEAVPAIVSLIENNAAGVLVNSPGKGVAPTVTGAGAVRNAALRALGRIGSEAAVRALLIALVNDDPAAQRSAVREALAVSGARAASALIKLLAGSPQGHAAAGAALVLGALHHKEGVFPILRAMQRGMLPLGWGLRALSELGAPSALAMVLEMLSDPDPAVRKEAIRAATGLLDPAHPDGRSVDPAQAALAEPGTPLDEKVLLCRLLGRTGTPRAAEQLLPLAASKHPALRLAAIEALGTLRVDSPAVDQVLMAALDDTSQEVRFQAAAALGRVGGVASAWLLLERLTVAAEQDRGALGLSLSGALARATDAALAAQVHNAVTLAPDTARDALIEGLGRMHGAAAYAALAALASGAIDDRRKVAEALAGHPEATSLLVTLSGDLDPGVRANALWSLGAVGTKAHLGAVAGLLKDPDVAVAGNAAGTFGRLAAREGLAEAATATLCPALSDVRPYVRANALAGLALAGATCEPGTVRFLLAHDPSEAVRLSAADHVARSIARQGAQAQEGDLRALARCASEEHDATVASRCRRSPPVSSEVEDIAVYVVPDGRTMPVGRAPFTLVRADGLLRLGLSDRRGELFEMGAPRGVVRLGVPAALAR